MRKHIDQFVYGTHYYRSPTPPPSEWETDFKKVTEAGINVVQFRANWSFHERKKGEFRWAESDRFFELAAKNGLKVNFKFLLECAPYWLYDKLSAWRVAPSGTILKPYNRGAFYTGGFMPCFDRNDVRKEAENFIKAAVKRYSSNPDLVLWNVWNEPRSRPYGECACEQSNVKYRQFLKKKFGSIEQFNDHYGFAFGDFEQVTPPTSHRSYAEIIEWRLFRAEMVAERVAWIAKFVRTVDASHPIIAHSGFVSPLMDPLTDMTNDSLNGKELDFYGSSSPTRDIDMSYLKRLKWPHKYTITPLVCDRLRGLDEYFFAHELYPNNADFDKPIPTSDMELDIWNAIANGAKGTMFWQYKSERLGDEVNRSGLVKVSGEPTDKYRAAASVGACIKKNNSLFRHSKMPKGRVGIIYDIESDLLSRLQVTTDTNYPETTMFGLDDYEYKRAIRGAHMAFWEENFLTDVIPSERPDLLSNYPVIYMPLPLQVSDALSKSLCAFVEAGGTLISEASPGIRQPNYWLSGTVPRGDLRQLFGCCEKERYYTDSKLNFNIYDLKGSLKASDLVSVMECEGGKKIGSIPSVGTIAVENKFGKGKAILLGFSLGACHFNKPELAFRKIVKKCGGTALPEQPIKLSIKGEGINYRIHETDKGHLIFIMNFSAKAGTAASPKIIKAEAIYGVTKKGITPKGVKIPARSCVILKA